MFQITLGWKDGELELRTAEYRLARAVALVAKESLLECKVTVKVPASTKVVKFKGVE